MDLLTAVVTVIGPNVSQIVKDIWDDYRTGRQMRLGIAANSQGYRTEIPNVAGVLSIPETGLVELEDEYAPVLLKGRFLADSSFIEFTDLVLEEEEKKVVILIIDEDQDVYFFKFGFGGYTISILPGSYSMYAFIINPFLDVVLGFGYPNIEVTYDDPDEYSDDPNPIPVPDFMSGEEFQLDFMIFDPADIE